MSCFSILSARYFRVVVYITSIWKCCANGTYSLASPLILRSGDRRADVVTCVVILSGLRKLVHCPCHELCNVVSIKSYMQWNDVIQMQNYGHDERSVPASYNVHTQEPRFPCFGRKMLVRVGIGASSNSNVRFGFVFGGLQANGSTCA